MNITNETVYVIYKDGQPFNSSSRKIVYTKKGSANGVITTEAKDNVYHHYSGEVDWYLLDKEYRNKLIEDEKSRYSVVEYTPKGDD